MRSSIKKPFSLLTNIGFAIFLFSSLLKKLPILAEYGYDILQIIGLALVVIGAAKDVLQWKKKDTTTNVANIVWLALWSMFLILYIIYL